MCRNGPRTEQHLTSFHSTNTFVLNPNTFWWTLGEWNMPIYEPHPLSFSGSPLLWAHKFFSCTTRFLFHLLENPVLCFLRYIYGFSLNLCPILGLFRFCPPG